MSETPMYTVSLDRTANQPVAEGIHPFLISDITEGESSNGNPMWTVRLTCLSEGADNGKEATLWLVLTESARWKLEKFFDAVGAPTTGTVSYNQFIGRKLKAQISHKTHEGQLRANVGEMFPMSSVKNSPVSTSRVKSAQATPVTRTGQAAGGPAKVKVPAKAAISSKGLPKDTTDEDIPFEVDK